jgi:hypothetical protein
VQAVGGRGEVDVGGTVAHGQVQQVVEHALRAVGAIRIVGQTAHFARQ